MKVEDMKTEYPVPQVLEQCAYPQRIIHRVEMHEELVELLGLAADYVYDVCQPDGTPDYDATYLGNRIRAVLTKAQAA